MKRVKYIDGVELYDIIRSRENVAEAVKEACKDHHRDPAVIRMKANPDKYIDIVCDILNSEAYSPSGFKFKTIFERGKWRHLCFSRSFPDRVIHHAVMRVVVPIIIKGNVDTSFAAVKGQGMHRGSRKIRWHIQKRNYEETRYVYKIDIHHYFDNVDRDILFDMLKKKIKSYRTLKILAIIIYECPGDNGLCIGLYPSQVLSVFYLIQFDHYCREVLRIEMKYRYMDDIVILSHSKRMLWRYHYFIKRYLSTLKLSVKGNYAVFPMEKRRLDFMGFVMNHQNTMIRKSTKIRYKRSCNRIVNAVAHREEVTPHMLMSKASYEGTLLNWCDGQRLVEQEDGRVFKVLEFGIESIRMATA